MNRILNIALFSIILTTGYSQQDPQFSQNLFNIQLFNPGYSGSQDAICAMAINRQQWIGFDGAPVSSAFMVNSPFRILGTNHGAGIHILNDQLGFETNLSINISYAYRIDMGNGKLGIGAGFGIINSALKAEWFVPGGNLHTPPSGDPVIPAGNENIITYDFSGGLFYYTDNYYLGFSSTHINEAKLEYSQTAQPILRRNYYMTAGYTFFPANQDFKITPMAVIQTDGAISRFDFGGVIDYRDRLWGGVGYRVGSAIIGMAGIELFNGVNIGYSYDFTTSSLSNYSRGTHELSVRYCFELDLDKTPLRYRSIRLL